MNNKDSQVEAKMELDRGDKILEISKTIFHALVLPPSGDSKDENKAMDFTIDEFVTVQSSIDHIKYAASMKHIVKTALGADCNVYYLKHFFNVAT